MANSYDPQRDVHVGYSLDIGKQLEDSEESENSEPASGEELSAREVEKQVKKQPDKEKPEEDEEFEEKEAEEPEEEFEEKEESEDAQEQDFQEKEVSEEEPEDVKLSLPDLREEDAVEIIRNENQSYPLKLKIPAKKSWWKWLILLAIIAIVLFFVFRPAKQPEITPETSPEHAETPSVLVQPEIVQPEIAEPEVNVSEELKSNLSVENLSTEEVDILPASPGPKTESTNADDILSEIFESKLKE